MLYSLNDEQIAEGKELFAKGFSYYAISWYYKKNYDLYIPPESVRYYITRKDKPKVTVKEKLANDGVEKVLILSDLHIPYNRDDILDIVSKHKDEISTLVIGGDVVDCYSCSSFPTLEPLPLVEEMAACHKILKQTQDMTPNVRRILIKGNHEERYKKHLIKISSELNKLHSDNILKEIVKGFEHNDRANGKVIKYDRLDYEVVDNWWCMVNKTIIAHPISFSRVAAKTAQMALDYFVERGHDFDSVLIAHTHKISSAIKYGKYSYEIGCLCKTQDYSESGRLTYERIHNGYFLAVYVNGQFDPNESRQYILK